jgi:hypothetical protein
MANSKISALTAATTPVAGTEVLPIVQSSATVKLAISDLTPGLSTITAAKGGTGQTTYAVGDLLYASTATTLSKLADVATGNALISGGIATAPSWGKIGLTTHVSGVMPVANGGTNASSASITAFNNITGYSASGATGTTTTNLVFSTSPTITTPSIAGDATLTTGNLIVSNGKGIDFSATPGTGTSELLADYEEGTFTPTVSGSSTAGAATYLTRNGWYTKVGRQVTFTIYLGWSAHTGTGDIVLSGLPFTSNASAPIAASTAMAYNFAMPALTTMVAWVEANASNVSILTTPVGGGAWNLLALDPVVDAMFVSGSYFV